MKEKNLKIRKKNLKFNTNKIMNNKNNKRQMIKIERKLRNNSQNREI